MKPIQSQPSARRPLVVVGVLAVCAIILLVPWLYLQSRRHAANQQPLKQTKTAQPPLTPAQQDQVDKQSAELATLLDQIAQAKGDYALAVAKPNGPHAAANGDKIYQSASTYKLFVAYAVYQQIDAGTLAWSDTMIGGQDAAACFEAMIVRSDNDCAKALGRRIGWQTITDMVHPLGLTNTHVEEDHHRTTANDLVLFLSKLQDGSLLRADHQTELINLMKRQVYRLGIPKGAAVPVADKVGFLDGLLHDAGIVYAPNGAYVLVILSNGSSWSQLADAAQQINIFMEQQ